MEEGMLLTTANGKVLINEDDVDCFRGITGEYQCAIYLKNGDCVLVKEDFRYVNSIFYN